MAANIILLTWGPQYQIWYEFLRDGFLWTTPISAIMIAISVFSLRASLIQSPELSNSSRSGAQRQRIVPSAMLYRAIFAFIAIGIFSPLYLVQRPSQPTFNYQKPSINGGRSTRMNNGLRVSGSLLESVLLSLEYLELPRLRTLLRYFQQRRSQKMVKIA